MHYCFLTTGTWEGNASFVRLREFGNETILRGIRVSYVLDDLPFNREREKTKLNPQAQVLYVPAGGFAAQAKARRRIIKQLGADFVHVLNPDRKAMLALAGTRQKVMGDWDAGPARP